MSLETWILFCITEVAICLSPGPAVLYVLSQGLGSGFRASAAANGGIVAGNIIYFIISATGWGALLVASHDIFFVAKWLGTAYLLWLGIQYFLTDSFSLAVKKAGNGTLLKVFNGGLILQLANPKNIIFFMAILPQFININASVPLQILILGITSVVIETAVLLSYGALGSHIEAWARAQNQGATINRISGVALIVVGVSLIFIQKAS